MTTDPSHVLPMAVEAAQKLASDMVADAIRAAERAGYERGRAEKPSFKTEALVALLNRARSILDDVEQSGTGIDSRLDDVSVVTRREARKLAPVSIPSSDDSFDDVLRFVQKYGGDDVVKADDVAVDTSDVREIAETLLGECRSLRATLDEIVLRLHGEDSDETSAERDARLGVITQEHADDVSGRRRG